MPIQQMFLGGAGAAVEQNFYQDIVDAGLSSGLQVCLDAGSAASYSSGQKWLDLSGNGQDFFRGADGTPSTDDPTHNGTPGDLSSTEYWSFDGADIFRYDSANETWMNNMHKNNAKFSFAALVFLRNSPGNIEALFGSQGNLAANKGISYRFNTTRLRVQVSASGSFALDDFTNTNFVNENAWNFIGLAIDEAAGASGSRHWSDRSGEDLFNGAYSSPVSTDATYILELAALGNVSSPIQPDCKILAYAFWDGVALTAANFSALHSAIGGRVSI